MRQEKIVNDFAMVPWEFVPDDLIDEIENNLRIWCDNVEVYLDRKDVGLGLNVPMQEDQEEVIPWHELNSVGLVGAINYLMLLERNCQIALDWVQGKSPGILVCQIPMQWAPEHKNDVIARLSKYGYQIEGLTK